MSRRPEVRLSLPFSADVLTPNGSVRVQTVRDVEDLEPHIPGVDRWDVHVAGEAFGGLSVDRRDGHHARVGFYCLDGVGHVSVESLHHDAEHVAGHLALGAVALSFARVLA